MNNTEKKRQFLINAAYYLLIAAILYGILKYAAPIFLPFILAFLIVWILRKPTLWIAGKTKIPAGVAGILVLNPVLRGVFRPDPVCGFSDNFFDPYAGS